ncbi:MAG: ParB/RepB/Spo0J family partition protein [Actinomycetia bacterium]|nr:ParB/RepB/Spo0J family partition protein [Actinomycetes bacterium]
MAKARGLGRGLASLIPDRGTGRPEERGPAKIPVASIDPNPSQPRQVFDEESLRKLAESIRLHGMLQPVLVRPVGDRYQLVVGERRWRAAQLAELTEVPAIVGEWDDRQVMELALVENLEREDLNPIEEAEALNRLVQEFAWTQEEVAQRVGRSRPHVANYLRLLQLGPEVRGLVAAGELSVAHAKVLLGIPDPERTEVARRCVREGWTVRDLERFLRRREGEPPAKADRDVHLIEWEERLRRRFGTKVLVKGSAERGRIVIPYASLEELERLLGLLESDGEGEAHGFVV